jgi:hypothetical protein
VKIDKELGILGRFEVNLGGNLELSKLYEDNSLMLQIYFLKYVNIIYFPYFIFPFPIIPLPSTNHNNYTIPNSPPPSQKKNHLQIPSPQKKIKKLKKIPQIPQNPKSINFCPNNILHLIL